MNKHTFLILFPLLSLLCTMSLAQANPGFTGEWVTDRELSTALDPFNRIELNITVHGSEIHIEETYTTGRRNNTERFPLDTHKAINVVPVTGWMDNRHLGAFIGGDKTMNIKADWADEGNTLRLEANFILETAQGDTPVRTYTEYRLSRDGERLTRIDLRSTRNRPVIRVFHRR